MNDTDNAERGFILDTAFGIPDETPVENVRALFRSVHRY
jgi:uroporphyrinogen-III decarboxylase